MLTIKVYLKESGAVADMRKDFPVYQGQYQNVLLNVFVPMSVLAPNFQEIAGNVVISPYTSGTTVKVAMQTIERNGAFKMSNDYYLRFVKTLVKDGVSYALFERNLPRAFTEYAGQGVNAPTLIINAVNVKYGEITSATASASNTELSVATDLTEIKETFLAVSQTYTFTYNADMVSWTYLTNAVVLSDYGLTVTGTPKDQDVITLNIVASAPTITSVLTSQNVNIDVLPSALLDKDEAVETSEWDSVNAKISSITQQLNAVIAALAIKQNQDDSRLNTTAKTVVGAINELDVGVSDNAMDINELQTSVSALEQSLSTGENYIGTMKTAILPTDTQLDLFVAQNTNPSRAPKAGDVVIVVQLIAGATDKNFKYSYKGETKTWGSYEIPPIEEAANGSLGVVQGTYNVEGKNYDMLVDVVGGEIKNIYIHPNESDVYVKIADLIRLNASKLNALTDTGNLVAKKAESATNDGKGRVIDATYQTKTDGASKQYVRDYALPKEFNNVFYFTKDGFAEELTAETTISDGVQSSAIGYVTLAEKSYTLGDVIFQIGKKNAYSNSLWIGATTAEDVTVRVTTSVTQGKNTTVIAITNTPFSITTSGVRVDIRDIMSQLGETVITAEKDTVITQKVEIFREVSAANTFTLYSTLTNPSMFYLYTGAVSLAGAKVVQETGNSEENVMSQKAVTAELNKRSLTAKSVDFPHGEPTSVTYDTTDGMTITGTMRVYTADDKSSYYDVESVSVEFPLIAGDNVNIDVDETNKTVVIKSIRAIGVDIGASLPSSTEQGTLTAEQFAILTSDENNYIMFQHEKFYLEDKGHVEGYITYTHTGYESNVYWIKSITITISTRAWVLNKVGLAGQGLEIGTDGVLKLKLGTNLSFGTNGEVNAQGGSSVDADTLNGLLTGSNGITTAKNTAGDKVVVKSPIPIDVYFVQLTDTIGQYTVTFKPDVDMPSGPYTAWKFICDNQNSYYDFDGFHLSGASETTSKILFYDGPLSNVKTLFGNQSIYGSGNIDLYRHNINIQMNNGSSEIFINFVSSSNTPIDSLTDLFTALSGTSFIPCSGHVDGNPAYRATFPASGGINFITLPNGSATGRLWSGFSNIVITDEVTTV